MAIDYSQPRKMYWSYDPAERRSCPECGAGLRNEYASYMMAVKTQRGAEALMSGNKAGYFCPRCPVVVLDGAVFEDAALSVPGAEGVSVGGIVNLAAVPEDKRDALLGEPDNPIPLVAFLNTGPARGGTKIGRNEPCPCGSGKKNKKCCGR